MVLTQARSVAAESGVYPRGTSRSHYPLRSKEIRGPLIERSLSVVTFCKTDWAAGSTAIEAHVDSLRGELPRVAYLERNRLGLDAPPRLDVFRRDPSRPGRRTAERRRRSQLTTAALLPLVVVLAPAGMAHAANAEGRPGPRTYSIVVEGYDWGAGVSKAVLSMNKPVSSASARDYSVAVKRHTDCAPLPPSSPQAKGSSRRLRVGRRRARSGEGTHVTLVLAVAPGWPLSSPLHYVRNDKCRGNVWVDYDLTVTDKASGRVWDTDGPRAHQPARRQLRPLRQVRARRRQDAVLRVVHAADEARRSPRS